MSFLDKLKAGIPTISCEFFPPKNTAGWSTLYSTMGSIARHKPDYVSVTYGAGGSTREMTIDLVRRIEKELGIEAMAHLTCVGHSKQELDQILSTLKSNNVHSVMALRGDPPKGASGFEAHSEGFSHANELIAFARRDADICIGCAFYPEKHLEAESLEKDIEYLKLKQDSGADFAVSQIFFDNDSYFRYRELAGSAGVRLPLVAGILPITSRSQVTRIAKMCGSSIPTNLTDILDKGSDDDVTDQGVDFAIAQSEELLKNGVAGIHLYSFNKSNSSVKIIKSLRASGYFPAALSRTRS